MLNIKLYSKLVYDEKYIKVKVKTYNEVAFHSKIKCTLPLHSSNNYWFCHKNRQKKLLSGLFRRIQIQNKEKKKMTRFIEAELKLDDSDDCDYE